MDNPTSKDKNEVEKLKINFACGRRTNPNYFNIDAIQHPKASHRLDLLYQMKFLSDGSLRERMQLSDGIADQLQAMHFIEHVFRWEAESVLLEFKRVLKPGGKLILELPNLLLACKNLLAGLDDQMSMWPIYGDWNHKDPLMMHKHGYSPKTITRLVKSCGFIDIKTLPPQTHKSRTNRDMRVEAINPK